MTVSCCIVTSSLFKSFNTSFNWMVGVLKEQPSKNEELSYLLELVSKSDSPLDVSNTHYKHITCIISQYIRNDYNIHVHVYSRAIA